MGGFKEPFQVVNFKNKVWKQYNYKTLYISKIIESVFKKPCGKILDFSSSSEIIDI